MAFVDDLFLALTARPSVHSFFLGVPCRSEVWEWVLRGCIFDSCPSSWSRGTYEFPIILHIRLIRVGCYATASNEAERPEITRVQVSGSYL